MILFLLKVLYLNFLNNLYVFIGVAWLLSVCVVKYFVKSINERDSYILLICLNLKKLKIT